MPYLFMNNSDELIEIEDAEKKRAEMETMSWQAMIDDNGEP